MMKHRLMVGFVLALTGLLVNGLVSYLNIENLKDNAQWVAHTHQVQAQVRAVLVTLTDAEAGQHGYLLTGQKEYLGPCELAFVALPEALDRLTELTADNPRQQGRISLLRHLIETRLTRIRDTLGLEGTGTGAYRNTVRALSSEKSLATMDDIRKLVDEMEVEENDLLQLRAEQSRASAHAAIVTLATVTAVGVGLVALVALLTWRSSQAGRRAAEEAAQARLTFELSGVAQAQADPATGRFLRANPKLVEMTGYSAEELLQRTFSDITHPEDRAADSAKFRRMVQGEVAEYQCEKRYLRRDGRVVWVQVTATLVRDANGRPVRTVAVIQDLSDRKEAEAALRVEEARFRQLADAMPQIVWTARPDGYLDYYNRRWYEFTGIPQGQLGEASWKPVLHPDDQQICLDVWYDSVRTGQPYEIEYRLKDHRTDSYRWHLGRALPVHDENGSIVRWFGTCTDIDDQKLTEEALLHVRQKLEERVLERTAELAAANADFRREIEERRRAEQEVRQAEQRYRSLVEATTSMVWHTSASGDFLTEQAGWSAFTGQTFEQCHGWGWLEAIYPDERLFVAHQWSIAVASRSLYETEHRVRRHDGEYRHMLARAVPIVGEDGQIQEWVGVYTDIDVQKRAEVALREAKEAADAANKAKSEFLANMSHEIRTPMNGILGMTQLALDSDLTVDQRSWLETVNSSAEALLTLINDILDFSKVEAGKLDLDPLPFRLRNGLEDILKPLALRAQKKGLEWAYQVRPDVPDHLVGDLGRLRQVILNLVGNAVKFTHRGGVLVRIEAEGVTADGLTLRVAVADTGPGIPAEKLELIFQPFVQADGSIMRKYGGTGLGLSISAHLVELMGGRIWAESEVGKGTTFRFTARLGLAAPGESQPGLPAPASPEAACQRPLCILLAEDNLVNQRVAIHLLAKSGHTVVVANNGLEVLAAVERQTFDLCLMDLQMPEMDGLETTRALRRREDGTDQRLPVIALTAHAMKGDRERCLQAGMDGYVTKPIQAHELARAIAEAVPGATLIESLSPLPPLPAEPKHTAAAFDQDELLERLGGDQRVLSEVIKLFRKEYPRLLGATRDALVRGDARALSRSAHTLRGTTANLSAMAASSSAQRLEALAQEGDLAGAAVALTDLEGKLDRLQDAMACLVPQAS